MYEIKSAEELYNNSVPPNTDQDPWDTLTQTDKEGWINCAKFVFSLLSSRDQQIQQLQSDNAKLREELAKAKLDAEIWESATKNEGELPCGHPDTVSYTEDGGKHIGCYVCELAQARADGEAMRRVASDLYDWVYLHAPQAQSFNTREHAQIVLRNLHPGHGLVEGLKKIATLMTGWHVFEKVPDVDHTTKTLTEVGRIARETLAEIGVEVEQ